MLKMVTGNIVIAEEYVDLYWESTAIGRQRLLENVAAKMLAKFNDKVADDTVFYYEVESKINRILSNETIIEKPPVLLAKKIMIGKPASAAPKRAAFRIPVPVREKIEQKLVKPFVRWPADHTNTDWNKINL